MRGGHNFLLSSAARQARRGRQEYGRECRTCAREAIGGMRLRCRRPGAIALLPRRVAAINAGRIERGAGALVIIISSGRVEVPMTRKDARRSGFTLIELLVVIAII